VELVERDGGGESSGVVMSWTITTERQAGRIMAAGLSVKCAVDDWK
jgi:hypothetical protein